MDEKTLGIILIGLIFVVTIVASVLVARRRPPEK